LQGESARLKEIQQTLMALYVQQPPIDAPAASTFSALDLLAKVDVSKYTPSPEAKYPNSEYGMALKQVAQIAKAEIGLEVACIDIGGWDTHNAQGQIDGEFQLLLAELSAGLAAFYHDLRERASRVTIVTMSEFGRRAYENGSGGTDHGHGNCMFVLGGGVNGGKVYGRWPGLAQEALYGPGDLAITTDFRDVLGEIVEKRLKNPALARVFPGYSPAALDLFKSETTNAK
jgi:uncharacterized protein (DUF1501 family)